MKDIEELRELIDRCDRDMLAALIERATYVERIKALKQLAGLEPYDPVRKADLIDALLKRSAAAKKTIPPKVVVSVFGAVHDAFLELMCDKPAEDDPLCNLQEAFTVGGQSIGTRSDPFYIAGPCAVESRELLVRVLDPLAKMGVKLVRGGAFKPRTSPTSFQGLGAAGMELLHEEATSRGLSVVTEVLDQVSLDAAVDLADVIQIGTRNMSNFSLLKRVGAVGKPVLFKRGYGATLDEWLQAAAYLTAGGCDKVIFCERGIRTFERSTRNTLDLSTVALLKERYGYPVVVDVSHAAGRRDILTNLTKASFAVGADGVMVEVHADPSAALSDADQQLTVKEFGSLAWGTYLDLKRAPMISPGGVYDR